MKTNYIPSAGRLWKKLILVLTCLFFIITTMINILPFLDKENALMDFGSFYASGLKIRNGENPYDPNSEYIFEINFTRIGAGGKMVNLNPPISVMIFEFLSRFAPDRSLLVWQITSLLLYIALIFRITSFYRQNITPMKFIWAFTLAGFWHTLVLGQIYVLLLAFTVFGWIFLKEKRYISAGIMIGLLIAIKPNFAIWALFLLASGYYITFAASLLTSLVISLIPVIFYGTKIYTQWLEASALQYATLIMPGNNSILGLTARFQSIGFGIVLSIALVLLLLALLRQKMPNQLEDPEQVSALGILASILASPISWTGYTILILPIFFSLKRWPGFVLASATILSIPFAIVLQLHQTSFLNFVIFGWLYGWGIFLLLGEVVRNTMITSSIQIN